MKRDLDALMQAQGVDVLLVTGAAPHNPAMYYLTGGGHISGADLIKKVGETGVIFCNPMERDEAARTGLRVISNSQYPFTDYIRAAAGDLALAYALRFRRMLKDLGVTGGRLALFGKADVAPLFAVMRRLQMLMPELTIVDNLPDGILLPAMMTKDDVEIERIRRMGQVTTRVVGNVADFITGHKVKDEVLVKADGSPLTIGEVKSRINLWLAENGAENPEDCIFAQGRDAGVPHSAGTLTDALRLGQTIVFDIYPCEAGGGYFYDFTRTWCLGYAPDAALQLYEQVKSVYHTVVNELKLNEPFVRYQQRTCDLFEAMGHPTVKTQPETEEGYVHSLGHGVGLRVHEKPFSGVLTSAATGDVLVPGSIFTLEPGLYYPGRGLGVRLEDTYTVNEAGKFSALADYPLDLVLPMKAG